MEKKLSRLDRLRLDMGKFKRPPEPGRPMPNSPPAAGAKPLSDKAAAAIAQALSLMMAEKKS